MLRKGITHKFSICTTIFSEDFEEAKRIAGLALEKGSDLIEFRLDFFHSLNAEEFRKHFSSYLDRSILTLRSKEEGGRFKGSTEEYFSIVKSMSELGPKYIDVEFRMLNHEFLLKVKGSRLIVSYHDMKGNTTKLQLMHIRDEGSRFGIVKIVSSVEEDESKILSLYEGFGGELIAFCMGERAIQSRFRSLVLGAPLAYVTLERSEQSRVLGQPTLQEMLNFRRSLAG